MMDYQPSPPPPVPWQRIRERVTLPGIFLAVIGFLNLVVGGILFVGAMQIEKLPEDEFRKAFEEAQKDWSETQKDAWEQALRQGWTVEKLRQATIKVSRGWGIVAAVVGLLGLIGGIRMAMLRSYGLAMFGAILTAIPFASPSACCLLGVVVGIWALVVLFNSDVQGAFRRGGGPPPDEGMLR